MIRTFNYFLAAAIIWLAVATVLFFLPGSALPSSGWMAAVQFDKWVHIGIFSGLCFLWSRALGLGQRRGLWQLAVVAVAYGLLVEIIQHNLVANRSFDVYDLVADSVGVAVGIWAVRYIKK